jgi:hypothetical protein
MNAVHKRQELVLHMKGHVREDPMLAALKDMLGLNVLEFVFHQGIVFAQVACQ